MQSDPPQPAPDPEFVVSADGLPDGAAPDKPLTAAARRALEEAAERRRSAEMARDPAERGGPRGPEPTRYGDWERKGLAVDF